MLALLPIFGLLAGLTLEEAETSALAQHPDLSAASASKDGAEARARQARAALLPQLSASARYNLQKRSAIASQQSPGGAYSAGLDASVLLYDFGKSWDGWDAARASAQAAGADQDNSALSVLTNVRLAFIDALELEALVQVGEQTLANQDKHRIQIGELVSAGLRPAIDRAQAETLYASAKANLVRAQNDFRASKARLRLAMGWPDAGDFELAPTALPPLAFENQPLAELYELARAERPDLKSAQLTIDAREQTLDATKERLWPALRFGAAAGLLGDDLLDPGWSVSAGLSLGWTLFDGLGVYAAGDAADADVRIQRAHTRALEQNIRAELEAASIGVTSAKAQLEAETQAESSAQDLLTQAEARYAQGLGSALELADAQLARANAEVARIRVEYDLAAARVQLLHSLGRKSWN